MERRDYEVDWSSNGLDFRYSGTETVFATNKEDAKERAIQAVSRKMVMARGLIVIGTVVEI
ncbi:hypothetical protein [Indiicoccus explosivorum]|uniref:hypothetical protein n=1 Tax=Indiicoccus explosivorum TaxID=1917864 RepID=UPI000B4339DC|nr:hypothetical protein [Indiicoccus explosivorum]